MTEPIKEIQPLNLNWWLAGIGLVCGLLLGGFVVHWFDADNPVTITKALLQKAPVKVNVPVPVQVAPQLVQAPIAPAKVQTCSVQAYTPPAATRAHLLPKSVADNPKQVIVVASRVEPDDHPETITATIDTDTGQAVQSVVVEPLRWLAKDFHRELSADLVEKSGGPALRLQARQDIFQVKALHFHMMAGGDVPVPIFGMQGKPDEFIGVGLHMALP